MTDLSRTGATGYIGGEVLHRITNTLPDIEITALVRDVQKGTELSRAYPDVHIVHGDLDDTELIEKEAGKADLVISTQGSSPLTPDQRGTDMLIDIDAASTNHIASVKAIHAGLPSQNSNTSFIQISGATILSQDEIAHHRFGEPTSTIHSDYPSLSPLKAVISSHPNREVDNYLLALTAQTPSVKTAIIFAPIIYGEGSGPVHRRSIQIPELCRIALERGQAVQVGRGENAWGNVHVADLGEMFALLAAKAVDGDGKGSVWGEEGLYFAGAGKEVVRRPYPSFVRPAPLVCLRTDRSSSEPQTFGEIAHRIAEAGVRQGLIRDKSVESLSGEEIDQLSPHASAILGTNAREHAQRAKKVLVLSPRRHGLEEEIPMTLRREADARGV